MAQGGVVNIVESSSTSGLYKLVVNETWCKGCRICVDLCPTRTLEMVDSPDRWEGTVVKVVRMDDCNGCGVCEVECPDFAITVTAPQKKRAGAGAGSGGAA